MFTEETSEWRLLLGVGASVLLHLGAAAALVWRADASAAALEPAAMPEIEPPRAGIRRSSTTTINWIGYEEPTPHQAEQAPIDQAAQTRAQATPSAPPSTAQAAETVPPESETRRAEEPAPEPATSPRDALEESEADPVAPVPAQETAPEQPDASRRETSRSTSDERTTSDAQAPARQTRESQETPKAPPARETAERPPAPETAPAEPGEPSDRESPAASREEFIDEAKLGEPESRKGVRIRTVRPRWTHFTRITFRPRRNPLVEVAFNAEGSVAFAEILESAGSKAVDGPLLDAIYNWTALGEEIDALRPDTEEREGERLVMHFRIGLR